MMENRTLANLHHFKGKTTLKTALKVISIVEYQNGLDIHRVKDFIEIRIIIDNSIKFN